MCEKSGKRLCKTFYSLFNTLVKSLMAIYLQCVSKSNSDSPKTLTGKTVATKGELL